MMNNEEYVAARGGKCPYCGGEWLSGDSVVIESGIAWQEVSCADCEKRWNDIYKLVGWDAE